MTHTGLQKLNCIASLVVLLYMSGPTFSYFHPGTGPIVLSDVQCGGWEQKLVDCPNITPHCTHEIDTAVSCQGLCAIHGDLRLADQQGRVEVCISGHWSTVCDNGEDGPYVQVICRQLGYNEGK